MPIPITKFSIKPNNFSEHSSSHLDQFILLGLWSWTRHCWQTWEFALKSHCKNVNIHSFGKTVFGFYYIQFVNRNWVAVKVYRKNPWRNNLKNQISYILLMDKILKPYQIYLYKKKLTMSKSQFSLIKFFWQLQMFHFSIAWLLKECLILKQYEKRGKMWWPTN